MAPGAGCDISIHAPRVGSDDLHHRHAEIYLHFNPRSPRGERLQLSRCSGVFLYFNPRSPRGERPTGGGFLHKLRSGFQSTLPAWGATRTFQVLYIRYELFQSTLPAWGATGTIVTGIKARLFQSTLPAWGATLQPCHQRRVGVISIHAPRVGSDDRRFCNRGGP